MENRIIILKKAPKKKKSQCRQMSRIKAKNTVSVFRDITFPHKHAHTPKMLTHFFSSQSVVGVIIKRFSQPPRSHTKAGLSQVVFAQFIKIAAALK